MATIGVMDSGLGGLSVLRRMLDILPSERYIYYADSAHCPYGEKSRDQIRERCFHIVSMMIEEGAEAIVIACNTATSAAIADLRSHCSVPFVGMEPAVKPAVGLTRSGGVGVLATAGTLNGEKYLGIKNRYEGGTRIVESVGRGFVELVEDTCLQGEQCERTISQSLNPLLEQGADTIVLGCTHYPFLMDSLKKCAGSGVEFIDPAPRVALHLKDVLVQNNIGLASGGEADISLYTSADPGRLQKAYSTLLAGYPEVNKSEYRP